MVNVDLTISFLIIMYCYTSQTNSLKRQIKHQYNTKASFAATVPKSFCSRQEVNKCNNLVMYLTKETFTMQTISNSRREQTLNASAVVSIGEQRMEVSTDVFHETAVESLP